MKEKWLILFRHSTQSIHIRHIDTIKSWEWYDLMTLDSAPTRHEANQKREKYLKTGKSK